MPFAQSRKTTTKKTTKTTATVKKTSKSAKVTKKQQPATKRQKPTTKKQQRNSKNGKPAEPKYTKTQQIKGLETEKQTIQRDIQKKQQEYQNKEADVKKRLTKIESLNADIDKHQRNIDTIQHDIKGIDTNIGVLKGQIATLESELGERRERFIQSMRYMARHRSIQDKLVFVFSAKTLSQMYRRLRFVREYAAYQRAQGELLKQQQELVSTKHTQLETVRGTKANLLWQNRRAHSQMESTKAEQQTIVSSLQKDQEVLQAVISKQREKQIALDAQIDRLVSIEIEKARQRAAAEARARAAVETAARKAREADLQRRREAARRAAQENARRIAEAREREAKAREQARAAATEQARQEAEEQARAAEAERVAMERKAEVEKKRIAAEEADRRNTEPEAGSLNATDRELTGSFASNKGRLPMPLNGRIVNHYGQYNVEGLNNVKLSNSGINIKGSAGGGVRAVYRGEVSAVFSFGGTSVVMVRHGAYISVYANLSSVRVHKGQQVSTGQYIGNVAGDGILQFQLRKETAKLNPEAWLRH